MRSGMAAERYTFDTNILFYSIDAKDAPKHSRARRIIGLADSRRVPILLQTLGELSNAVTKRHPGLLSQVERLVHAASAMFAVVPTEFDDIAEALLVQGQHKLQFWDAVLWATARRAGCTTLRSAIPSSCLRPSWTPSSPSSEPGPTRVALILFAERLSQHPLFST